MCVMCKASFSSQTANDYEIARQLSEGERSSASAIDAMEASDRTIALILSRSNSRMSDVDAAIAESMKSLPTRQEDFQRFKKQPAERKTQSEEPDAKIEGKISLRLHCLDEKNLVCHLYPPFFLLIATKTFRAPSFTALIVRLSMNKKTESNWTVATPFAFRALRLTCVLL